MKIGMQIFQQAAHILEVQSKLAQKFVRILVKIILKILHN